MVPEVGIVLSDIVFILNFNMDFNKGPVGENTDGKNNRRITNEGMKNVGDIGGTGVTRIDKDNENVVFLVKDNIRLDTDDNMDSGMDDI